MQLELLGQVSMLECEALPLTYAPGIDPWYTLTWQVDGDRVRADHGYSLYGALVDALPILKTIDWQLGTINGNYDHGWLSLTPDSTIAVRAPLSVATRLSQLDGHHLRVGRGTVRVHFVDGAPLHPHPNLTSRIVIFKRHHGDIGEYQFGVSMGRALERHGIQRWPDLGKRRTLRVRDVAVVGYEVTFSNLLPDHSLWIQRYGLGGKRKMGAGVFIPC